jgi:hypothetical protein
MSAFRGIVLVVMAVLVCACEDEPEPETPAPVEPAPAVEGCSAGPCMDECAREYECARRCGDDPVSCGCCPCAEGWVDLENCEALAAGRASCSDDVDCDTCTTRDCHCAIAGSSSCGPGRCAADPCRARSASCWRGECVVRPAAAGPCESDDECEVRGDDCHCDLFAALATAAESHACEGQGCGTRPSFAQFHARCDTTAHRCVLERNE